MKSAETLLMVAAGASDADMLYATGLFTPDPFIYLRHRNTPYLVMSDLEFDRARREAPHCRILSWKDYEERLSPREKQSHRTAGLIRLLLREKKIRRVRVPNQFPAGLAARLQHLKIHVVPLQSRVFPEREIKSDREIRCLRQAIRATEAGLRAGLDVLRKASIGPRQKLQFQKRPLTSERLRAVINAKILEFGGVAMDTIVACGNQACDPHERGSGVLRAHSPIILDVFPRMQKSGFFGDITRTVVKGRAGEAIRSMYHAVAQAQNTALRQIKNGTPTKNIHTAVKKVFLDLGFPTHRSPAGFMEGFFHGTGHGLGLEIHESPRLGNHSKEILRTGNVITVEPGLYYRGKGGVRLEDVVLVTPNGNKNLVRLEKQLEI